MDRSASGVSVVGSVSLLFCWLLSVTPCDSATVAVLDREPVALGSIVP